MDSGSNPHPLFAPGAGCDLLRKSDAALYPQDETTNLRGLPTSVDNDVDKMGQDQETHPL